VRNTKNEVDWITSRFICVGYYALVAISKVKPITDEFDKTFEWKSVHEIPDHKVILEEALIVLRQKIGLSFENIGKRLSRRNPLSNGELYTILTNKAAKGKKGAIVAMIAGTKAQTVIAIIEKT
jgi:hypothetical protein